MTLSNLIVFCDEITRYADQRRTVDDAVLLSFNKAFNTISQRILLTKLVNYSLDVQTSRCNSCLESDVQRVVMNGFLLNWNLGTNVFPQVLSWGLS